ncbi:hypothetical protein CHN50_21330, partial [Priestia aryabhattai]
MTTRWTRRNAPSLYLGTELPSLRRGYKADVTYGTNNEFGFDYLRDNMASSLSECVQRG